MRPTPPPIAIEALEVTPERVEALVRVDERLLRTSCVAGLRDRALHLLPGLRRHTCENDDGLPFAAELADTETAHLVEHVTVELMALAGSPRSLRAETRWDFSADGRGRYRVAIGYDDDLVALGALKEAVGVASWLCGLFDEARPDVGAIAERLRALRLR